jgi:sucrose-6F-phosphate phosphohydrolase
MLLIYNTGRTLDSVLQLIKTDYLLNPDVLITDVGTEIHMGPSYICNAGWEMKMSTGWHRSEIEAAFASVEGLIRQPVVANYRLAYTTEKSVFAATLSSMNAIKETFQLPIEIVPSLEHIIDIVPEGAGKGPALSFVQKQMELEPEQIIVCGDSGNDLSMFSRGFRGIVVGNACPAFQSLLPDGKNTYRSPHPFAAGIMDGLEKFRIVP